MSCISGDTFLLPLSPRILPPAPSTTRASSLRPFPDFACTRGQINVDGAPRAPFFCPPLLPLSLVSFSRPPLFVLIYRSVRVTFSPIPNALSWSITRYDADLYSPAFHAGVHHWRRHFAIEPSRFRAAIEPIFYASFPLCHEHFRP